METPQGRETEALKEENWQESAIYTAITEAHGEPATTTREEIANTDKISRNSNQVSSEEIKKLEASQVKKAKKKSFFSFMRFIKRVLTYIKNQRNPFTRKKTHDVNLQKVDLSKKTSENRLPSDIKLYHNLIKQAAKALEKTRAHTEEGGMPRGFFREPGSVKTVGEKVNNFKDGKPEDITGWEWKLMASFIKQTVLSDQNPAMEGIQNLKLNEVIKKQNEEASTEDIVTEVRQKIETLPEEDKKFLKDLLEFLTLVHKKSWAEKQTSVEGQTPVVEEQTSSTKQTTTFEALLNGVPSIKNIFIQQPPILDNDLAKDLRLVKFDLGFVKFLVDHREEIFQSKEMRELLQ